MTFLDTPHKKRSFTITTILLVGLLLLMFFLGLGYQIPPPETGIAINFGTSDTGSGTVQPEAKTIPRQEQAQNEQTERDVPVEKTENVIAGNEEDAPVITPEKPKPKKDPTPSKSTQDALSNILNSTQSKEETQGSQGNDNRSGDKGSAEGNPYANSDYGSPGSTGTGVTYGLKGRSLVATGKVEQECNEEGRVVVKIEVDKNGTVISAVPGVKNSTNTHPCLLEPAKKTALMYRWNLDSDAPARQIGFVVINFKLGG